MTREHMWDVGGCMRLWARGSAKCHRRPCFQQVPPGYKKDTWRPVSGELRQVLEALTWDPEARVASAVLPCLWESRGEELGLQQERFS